MKKRGLTGAVVAVVISVLSLSGGCGHVSIPSSAILVPHAADSVARLEIAQILADEDFARLYGVYASTNPELPRTIDLALADLKDETGIDLRQVEEATLFASLPTLETEDPYWGAIVTWKIPARQLFLIAEWASALDFETEDYSGLKLYGLQEGLSLAFLSSTVLAVGPERAVKEVVDVGLGRGAAWGGQLREEYVAFGDVPVKAVLEVPPAVTRELSAGPVPEGGLGGDAGPLVDLETLGFLLDKQGSAVSVRMELGFSASQSASSLAVLIELLLSGTGGVSLAPELANVLDGASVAVSGAVVSLLLDTTVSELEELLAYLAAEGTSPGLPWQ